MNAVRESYIKCRPAGIQQNKNFLRNVDSLYALQGLHLLKRLVVSSSISYRWILKDDGDRVLE